MGTFQEDPGLLGHPVEADRLHGEVQDDALHRTGHDRRGHDPLSDRPAVPEQHNRTIEDTQAYVYRKANELIGEVVLKKHGDKVIAVPQSSRVGSKIKVGDRVLINVSKPK